MKNPLKPFFDFLTITGGEALVLFLLTGIGVAGLVWGSSSMTTADWLNWKILLTNIPLLLGAVTLVLTFLIYIGCMHDSEKRGLVLCAVCSILIHVGLFSWFACVMVGNRPIFEEQEVALNLNSKPPLIVNDYYFAEMPGDEVLDDETVDSVPRFTEGPQIAGPETPDSIQKDALEEDLKRTEETQEAFESQADQSAEKISEAHAKANEIQISELSEVEQEMTEKEPQAPQSFVDRQKFGQNVTVKGIIGAEKLVPNVRNDSTELTSAEKVQLEKINLRKEAQKKQAQKSEFRHKLEQNHPQPIQMEETKNGTIPSEMVHGGENEVAGKAQNWGETLKEAPQGGAGDAQGEIRSGLGEERVPAANAAGLKSGKIPQSTRKKGKKILVSEDEKTEKTVSGGQTVGARAGNGENLDAVISGSINGVSDAVLETTAKPQKVSGSNVIQTEKEEILKNVVVFRFEKPSVPEMGFQPTSEESREQALENLREVLNQIPQDEDSEALSGPEVDGVADAHILLKPGEAIRPEPSLPYRQRMRRNHQQMIEEAGGNPISEQIVEQGLQYMERNQFEDGHWSLNFLPNKLPEGLKQETLALGTIHADTAATGLSLLAFLGAGYTHLNTDSQNDYTQSVNRGLNWLLKNQQADGSLFTPSTDMDRYGRIYSQGIATIALCEAYGMTHDSRLREPAQRAINFIVKAQTPEGGWRYTPEKNDGVWRGESDTSVSGWQAMALVSAKMAGLNIPDDVFPKLDNWVKKASIDGGKRFCYLPIEKPLNDEMEQWKKPSFAMTAEGLLMELYLNYDPKKEEFQEAANYLVTNLPTVDQKRRDTYYWYYATQVLFHLHDARWKEWQANLVQALKNSQETENEYLRGSWNPVGPAPDHWGVSAGRHYVTAMHLLMLEVYYRHLPLFRELNSTKETREGERNQL